MPLLGMTASERDEFEAPTETRLMCWPEVGSRMMTRLITGQDVCEGWIVVQDGIYQYKIDVTEGFRVKTVVHEYLATEVNWHYA